MESGDMSLRYTRMWGCAKSGYMGKEERLAKHHSPKKATPTMEWLFLVGYLPSLLYCTGKAQCLSYKAYW